MLTEMSVDIAAWNPIIKWTPSIGDICIWHGWFTNWVGFIVSISKDEVTIKRAGLPLFLFTFKKRTVTQNIKIEDIQYSEGGEYAIIKQVGSQNVWYI